MNEIVWESHFYFFKIFYIHYNIFRLKSKTEFFYFTDKIFLNTVSIHENFSGFMWKQFRVTFHNFNVKKVTWRNNFSDSGILIPSS